MLLLSVVVFYVARLAPGDPLASYYGDRVEKMSPEQRQWAGERLGLNKPIHVQYIRWLGNAVHRDFGVLCAWHEDKRIDRWICETGTVVSCIPEFWLSLLLILVGTISGPAPKWLDDALMRFTEIFLRVPNLLLVILLQAILGKATVLSISLGIGLPLEVISRGSILSLSERSLSSGCWWVILFPGLFLVATLLSITNIGNFLRKSASRGRSNL